MHIGMLWFDDNPNLALKNKIEKAVSRIIVKSIIVSQTSV
jgi:hypothetical protein